MGRKKTGGGVSICDLNCPRQLVVKQNDYGAVGLLIFFPCAQTVCHDCRLLVVQNDARPENGTC